MLKKFRTNIDTIDKKLLELLNQRANIAKQVADYKKASNNKTIFRPDRESQIIKSLRASYSKLFRISIAESNPGPTQGSRKRKETGQETNLTTKIVSRFDQPR